VTFSAFSLAGQVMVEKARRDGIRAAQRARAASGEISALRLRVQALTSSSSIEQWAVTNGFTPADQTARKTGVN
jgi:P2-related tail formation protein